MKWPWVSRKELEFAHKRIDEVLNDRDLIIKDLQELEAQKESKPLSKDNHERLAELEVKMAKLWGLLTEKDLRGKEKLSRQGRLFGGRLDKS